MAMRAQRVWISAVLAAALLISSVSGASAAVIGTTAHVILYLDSTDAYVNNQPVTLEVPAKVKDGRTYLPAKFLGDSLGFVVDWIAETRTVVMETKNSYIEINQQDKRIFENGTEIPFDQYAWFVDGKLLVQMGWIADAMGAKYQYYGNEKKVEISYLQMPVGGDNLNPSKPVAKYTFLKPSYRIGEPVETIDLSYDPDGEGLTKSWSGLKPAYFQAGTYEVTLTVTDRSQNVSDPFKKTITITDELFLTEQEYPFYYQNTASSFTTNLDLLALPQLQNTIRYDSSRKLLVSDSPELITETGILYQDTVNGKGRLYANHQNLMEENVTFAIFATNNSDRDVKITTTNKGEVNPSPLANLMGHIASVDFLLDEDPDDYHTVKAHDTIVYKMFPQFLPSFGVNTFYDLETDGELTFSFVAMGKDDSLETFEQGGYNRLPYVDHVRGTFPTSDVYIDGNGGGAPLLAPVRLSIGDELLEPFIKGYDVFEQKEAVNKGNYGVTYHFSIQNPGKMAVLLRPRGGIFKGPVKINGQLILAPVSGTLSKASGVYLLKRTTGEDDRLDIEFTPPAGSNLPVDLILYPLKSLK
ncbi:stalk domain-containing protein [Paenibacillus thermotolerans]|uniref:stalk domain-containing protein n=1 Tax=Paenibacillus thermotolerans TaxID=3027807 RepID=UPI00236842CD|nr:MULTISPECIES: stalk domain-containing protein [unclassified Paenibacillus]